jgi:hypothetical protein
MVNHDRARMNRLPRPASAWAVAVLAAVATVVAITAARSGAAPATASHSIRPAVAGEPPVNWKMPLIGAHQTTLAAASRAAGFAVPMPDVAAPIRVGSGPANQIRMTLSQVWMNQARAIALVFNGGRVTVLVSPASYRHAGQAFRTELAAIKVGRAAIDRISGKPALVVQPRTDYTKSNPALVEVYRHGLDINVISTKLGTNTLQAIAATVRAP